MASAPNMRVAPGAAPTGTAAPAPADPLEFISRILAGQAQPTVPALAATVIIGESPLPDGATTDAPPEYKASTEDDALAVDPAPLDGLIPIVLAQGDYAVAVVVKGNASEAPADPEASAAPPESEAQPAPAAIVATPVPTIQAALPPTVPVAKEPPVVAKAPSGDRIVASKSAVTKPIATKVTDSAIDADTETKTEAKPAPAPAPVPAAKTAPAEKMIARDAPASALRPTAAAETPAPNPATPAPAPATAATPATIPAMPAPASAAASTPAAAPPSADADAPKDASAQIAAALRGAVAIPDPGARSAPRQRTVSQTPTRIAPSESAPQAQPLRPSDSTISEAATRGSASGPDNATSAQPTTPWSPTVAASSRPIEPPASRVEAPDQAIDRALNLARDGEWLDQLARDISSSGDRDGTLRFRLNPQALGQLRVELSQGELGTNIRMSVDTEAARTILTDAQSRLVSEARAQGVRIGETQVDLSGSNQHMSGDPRRQDEARQNPMIRTAPAAIERDAPSRAARSRSDRYA